MTQLTQEIIDAAPEGATHISKFGVCYWKRDGDRFFYATARVRSWTEDTRPDSGRMTNAVWASELVPLPTTSAVTAEEKQALLLPIREAHWSETPMTLDDFDERCANDDDMYRRLVDMRGGCRCCISPPCSACCTPMDESEAERLGWVPLTEQVPVTDSDRAGIASFEPPPEVVAEPEPVRVSTLHRRLGLAAGGAVMGKQPEALRLAESLDGIHSFDTDFAAAAELRRLSALNAELVEALRSCLAMLERADCSTGYCCCGSSVEGHGIGDGHGPVDEGDYHQCNAMDAARAALAKATP